MPKKKIQQQKEKQAPLNKRREINQAELDSVKMSDRDWKFILRNTNAQERTDIANRAFQSPGAARRTQVQRSRAAQTGLLSRAKRNLDAKTKARKIEQRKVKANVKRV